MRVLGRQQPEPEPHPLREFLFVLAGSAALVVVALVIMRMLLS